MERQEWVPVSSLCVLSAPPWDFRPQISKLNARKEKSGREDLRLRYEMCWNKTNCIAHHFLYASWVGPSWVQALNKRLIFLCTPKCAILWPGSVLPHVTAAFLQLISVNPDVLILSSELSIWSEPWGLVVPQLLSWVLNWNCKHGFVI